MSQLSRILIAAVGLLLTLRPAVAQEVAGKEGLPERWSLDECLQYARDHNITINNLRLSKESAAQNVIQAKAARLPDLNASISSSASHAGGTGLSVDGFSASSGVQSSWTLYNGGALRAGIRESQLAETSSELTVLEAENDLYLQVIQAYNAILADKETVKYADDLVATSTEQKNQMEALYKFGSVARKELVQMEAQLANDQYTLASARNAERQDKLYLKQLLQLPIGGDFEIEEVDTAFAMGEVTTLEETLNQALANRPEVKNGAVQIELAKTALDIAKAGYRPTISLNGGIGTNYTGGVNAAFSSQLNNNFYQQIGITASIPIFSRKVNQTNAARASIAIKQAELDLLNTKTLLSQDVEQAYIAVQNAVVQYQAAAEQLRYAEEAYRIASEELRVGTFNTVDFVQQRNLYVQALQSYTQAKYNALLALDVYEFYKNNRS